MKVVPLTPDDIAEKTALFYGIPMDELRGRSRGCDISEARTVAIYLTREWTSSSFSEIGEYYFRDHSSVVSLCEKAKKRVENDDEFKNTVNAIKENLDKYDPRIRKRREISAIERSGRQPRSVFMAPEATRTPERAYSIENFIVGPSNELAYKAARTISENAALLNPLCIYGGRGVGKTHLLHAIANCVAQQRSAICVTSEEFTNEFIDSVRRGYGDQFRNKYCGVKGYLLLDNVQFFAGKERIQEELFHIIHALNKDDAQLVVSANVLPQEILGLDKRLLQHFDGGQTIEIQASDDALKYKVLMQYIRQCSGDNIPIPDDVLEYVVKTSLDFHALLYKANTLIKYANLSGNPITIRDVIPPI